LLTIQLDFLSGVLPEQDGVARLDVEWDALAVVLRLAGAGGDDLALLRLFLGGVGDDDPADLLFAFFDALDDDAVVKRSDVHALLRLSKRGLIWALALAQNDCQIYAGPLALSTREC